MYLPGYGLKKDGLKEVQGMWMAETESASSWMSVLTDLKAREVEDILYQPRKWLD